VISRKWLEFEAKISLLFYGKPLKMPFLIGLLAPDEFFESGKIMTKNRAFKAE